MGPLLETREWTYRILISYLITTNMRRILKLTTPGEVMKYLASTHIYFVWVAQSWFFYQRNRSILHGGERDSLSGPGAVVSPWLLIFATILHNLDSSILHHFDFDFYECLIIIEFLIWQKNWLSRLNPHHFVRIGWSRLNLIWTKTIRVEPAETNLFLLKGLQEVNAER